VVEVDLDLCALCPVHRTRAALETVASEFGIEEFREAETLDPLPGYSDEAWLRFIQLHSLEGRYPHLEWMREGKPSRQPGTPFARFHSLYWASDGLIEDSPTPGLGSFVHRVESAGGRVVFLSGRWRKEQIPPSIHALRRAGIAQPALVIGNPWHETLVTDPAAAVSDSRIKAWHQQQICRDFGRPVAIFDDRATNRTAIQNALGGTPLGVAVAIPGFTCDTATESAPLRISTFEQFDDSVGTGPVRPHIEEHYPHLGIGAPWRGLYEGLGRNQLPYVLPRMSGTNTTPLFGDWIERHAEASLIEEEFLDRCADLIPRAMLDQFTSSMGEALALASRGLAHPYPDSASGESELRRVLIAAWLHSRDIEVLMSSLGYITPSAGRHDLVEWVSSNEIIALLLPSHEPEQSIIRARGYSPWLTRWAETLSRDTPVNVGLLNPALLVSFSRWTPVQEGPQDAMDVHRLSDHHDGDLGERYNPIEATVNNLLHQREGIHGVRKEPVVPWRQLSVQLQRDTGAESQAKCSIGREIVRDAARIGSRLERAGMLTPWGLVRGWTFD